MQMTIAANQRVIIWKKRVRLPNPETLRNRWVDQNENEERINEADVPRTSAQVNEDIKTEDVEIEQDNMKKKEKFKEIDKYV